MIPLARLLILAPVLERFPGGIPAFLSYLIFQLGKQVASLTVLIDKPTYFHDFYHPAIESYRTAAKNLEIRWLPADYFHKTSRHILTHTLEQILAEKQITTAISIGSYRCGFALTVAAGLYGCRHIPILLYEDCFIHHLNHAQALATVLQNSQQLACFHSKIVEHIRIFYRQSPIVHLLSTCELVDLVDEFSPQEVNFVDKNTRGSAYVLTAGHLSERHHLGELVDRLSRYLDDGKLWLHIGSISSRYLLQLARRLALLGFEQQFDVLGILERNKFLAFLKRADALVIAQGESNTGILAHEAEFYQVAVDYPTGYQDGRPISIQEWLAELEL